MTPAKNPHYLLCHVCSHPNVLSDVEGEVLPCERCGHENMRTKPKSPQLCLVFSLTALIFYIPANIFPFMTIELYGNVQSSTIWSGIVSLAESGSWPIAIVVFLASMLIPFLKLIILFYLSLTAHPASNARFKTKLFLVVESIGRWSMLDIYLLAVLVAMLKLGAWTTVVPEIGALLFTIVVIFTMLASANFDPQLLWKDADGDTR